MHLVEIRLFDGPNVYRLAPTVRVEVGVGRSHAWHGSRSPGAHPLVTLARPEPSAEWPDAVTDLVAWTRRLRTDHGEHGGPVRVHRASDAGRWVVTWPWLGAERARTIAEAAVDLAGRSVSPGRKVRLTGGQARLVERWTARIDAASTKPPAWILDVERAMPVVSVTGTNGKSTVTRLITHILLRTGRHVGTTTSDGILIDEQVVETGDWTGPGGAAAVLRHTGVDVAVLETARGGLVQRGIGYESNEASVFTNVSSDHLDLHGIHTLPELAEVKSTVCRITRPDGWAVLNADDPLVAAVARRVRARVALFSMDPDASPVMRRHLAAGGRGYGLRAGWLVELEAAESRPIVAVADVPVTLGGLARHNIANALAAAGGARAMGTSLAEIAAGLRDFQPSAGQSPGRLNLYRLGSTTVIVDFAHNEAGTTAILDVAEAIARRDGGSGDARLPVTAIVGTAGDRPDDTLRGIGRIAAERSDRIVVKESLTYLRGRSRPEVVARLLEGIAEGGVDPATVPVHETEVGALEAELGAPTETPRVIVLFCHEQRDEVFALLEQRGAVPIAGMAGIAARPWSPTLV